MGKRSNFERVEKDYYPTPLEAVHPLIPHILGYVKTFAEPCAGDGSLIRHIEYLTNNLFDIDYIRCNYACDIEPKDDGIHEKNIFNLLPKDIETSDVIITNPPWSRDILHRIIYHCTSIKPTWLLFDADWMHTKQSTHYRDMLKKIVSVGRVEWIKGSKNTGKDNCCWYYFDKDNKEQTQFFGRQT